MYVLDKGVQVPVKQVKPANREQSGFTVTPHGRQRLQTKCQERDRVAYGPVCRKVTASDVRGKSG